MGIEATTSSTVSSSSQTTQVSSSKTSETSKKTSSEPSFKDEMNKVSSNDKKENADEVKNNKDSQSFENKIDDDKSSLNATVDYSNYASMAIQDANMILSNNILEMVNNNPVNMVNSTTDINSQFAAGTTDNLTKNSISMSESDAQFFLNLTQDDGNEVSMQNVMAQAQGMLDDGAAVNDVKQNVQISQTLLDALSKARETNQPLRIDFDQNVSVILRIGKDGAIAANFIPGDKAVEQYLRNNISNLRAVFNENDLPYTELSYSNSSKQQNERRRNQQKQGEQ